MSKILTERDSLRNKLSELKQEKQNVQEKLKTANKSLEALKSQQPVEQRVTDLQSQVASMQLAAEGLRREKEEMAEVNGELRRNLEMAEIQLREADIECQRSVLCVRDLRTRTL